jgi:putative ABC transport system permease protein
MFWNYIKFTYRNILRNKIYSIISVSGLSFGMACFLLIVLYFQYQHSYDKFHDKSDRIYRVNRYLGSPMGRGSFSKVSPEVADIASLNIAEVEDYVRFSYMSLEFNYQDKVFREVYSMAADASVFEIFDYKVIMGDKSTVLSEPNSIVLDESSAKKYFGDEDPIGKVITTYDEYGSPVNLTVTGLMEDIPSNTHLTFSNLISFKTLNHFKNRDNFTDNWMSAHTYLLLYEGADADVVEKQLIALTKDIIPKDGVETAHLDLQNLEEIFFNPTKDGGSQVGDEVITTVFLILGIFILGIACINYINLSTARSLNRAREVGVRKVMGAERSQLKSQFIGESIIISFISLFISIFLIELFIPVVNNMSNLMYKIDLDIKYFSNTLFITVSFLTALATGLISGFYPAFVLSAYKPVKVLKGKSFDNNRGGMRKGLVVIQYVISIVLIIFSITVYRIFTYLQSNDLGYDKENLISLNLDALPDNANYYQFKQELRKVDGVRGFAAVSKSPATLADDNSYYIWDEEKDTWHGMPYYRLERSFFDLINVETTWSELFRDPDIDYEEPYMIVNKSFIEFYKGKYAVGDLVPFHKDRESKAPFIHVRIAGVVENFKYRNPIGGGHPMTFKIESQKLKHLLVGLNPGNHIETIKEVNAIFASIYPGRVFEFKFIEDNLNFIISMLSPFAELMFYGTFFAILIASIGLFALALFTTQQRTKEIGIRKVMGATEAAIVKLLSKQFIRLVLISFLIAGPITFWGFRTLLQMIPDKIPMSWLNLGLVAVAILALAFMTVGGQAWKASKTDPVETLRDE